MKAIFTAFSWQFYNIITYSHSHAGMVCRGVVLHQREYSIKAACVFFFFLVHLARSVRSLRCCFDGLNCGISDFLGYVLVLNMPVNRITLALFIFRLLLYLILIY